MPDTAPRARTARVAVVRTRPETVLADYGRVMDLAGYRDTLSRDRDTLIKLNLSWTKYFPSCSSQPWQVDGVVGKMLADGYSRSRLIPIENKTVVTNPREGCRNNRWESVLRKHGLTFQPLTEVDWMVYRFKSPLLKLNEIFPEGIQIPTIYPGRQILHLPTMKTHGHAVMTGSVKNSFGGLLREVRHYAHKYMHEVLVDLLYMQRELHPAVFTVMDGTVAVNPELMKHVEQLMRSCGYDVRAYLRVLYNTQAYQREVTRARGRSRYGAWGPSGWG